MTADNEKLAGQIFYGIVAAAVVVVLLSGLMMGISISRYTGGANVEAKR